VVYAVRLFFTIILVAASSIATAFEGGSTSNTLRWFVYTAWSEPENDSPGVSILAHIPLSSGDPLDGEWSKKFRQSQRIAPGSTQAFGEAVPALRASIPVSTDGRLLLQWIPRAIVKLGSTWNGAQELLNDTNNSAMLNVRGTLNTSTHIEGDWSTLGFGYQIIAPDASLSLGIQRHTLTLTAAGQSSGDITANMSTQGASGDSTDWEMIQANYDTEIFNSSWAGKYQGSGWSASIKAHYGCVHYYGQMGATIKMLGEFSLNQTLPYFLDSVSYKTQSDSLAHWTDPVARDLLSANTTTTSRYSTRSPMQFVIPQTHTLGIDFSPWVSLEYTYVAGSYALTATRDSLESTLDFRTSIEHSWNPNHLTLLHINSPWTSLTLGGFWMKASPWPILTLAGFYNAKPIGVRTDFEVLPWIRLFVGVSYAL